MKEKNDVVLILLSFDEPIQTMHSLDAAPIFAPKSTWTAGRNALLRTALVYDEVQHHTNRFKYFVFADDEM